MCQCLGLMYCDSQFVSQYQCSLGKPCRWDPAHPLEGLTSFWKTPCAPRQVLLAEANHSPCSTRYTVLLDLKPWSSCVRVWLYHPLPLVLQPESWETWQCSHGTTQCAAKLHYRPSQVRPTTHNMCCACRACSASGKVIVRGSEVVEEVTDPCAHHVC